MSEPATRPRRRWRFWLAVTAGVLVGVPVLLVALLLIVLNTAPGQRAAEGVIATMTGGSVRLRGLHGRVPDAIRLDELQVSDATGVWLDIEKLQLDWSPRYLLSGEARVRLLFADRVAVTRLPVAKAASRKPGGGFSLPVALDAERLAINDLYLGAPVAQAAAHLSVAVRAQLRGLNDASASVELQRTDAPGAYRLDAVLTGAGVNGRLSLQEPSRGLISTAAHLPDLGAIGLDATLAGPRAAAVLRLALAAGALRAEAHGTLDLVSQSAGLAVSANAPAMTLAPGFGWQSVALEARVAGKWARPSAAGTLRAIGVQANGAAIAAIDAQIAADTHTASLQAQATGVRLPAPNEGLLAGGPLTVQAKLDLDDPRRPVTYGFQQALLSGQGTATLAPRLAARLDVSVPDLEVLARAGGRDVTGSAGFTLLVAQPAPRDTRIDLDAAMTVTGGANAPAAVRGRTTLGATVRLDGGDIEVSRLRLDDRVVHADATASRQSGRIAAQWRVSTADLHALVTNLRGDADLTGHLAGTLQDFAAAADLTGSIGNAALAPAPVHLIVTANGLPARPAGRVQATAMLDGSPLALDAEATRGGDQTLQVAIHAASWKSARLAGSLSLAAGAKLPSGVLTLAVPRLDDLRALIGQPISGSISAALNLPQQGPGTVTLDLRNAGLAGRASVGTAHLAATVADPSGTPRIAGRLAASGIRAGAIEGQVSLAADGTLAALGLKLAADLHNLAGADAVFAAAGTLNTTAKLLRLARMTADWHGAHVALGAPASVSYAPGLAVDRLTLTAAAPGSPAATAQLAGRISPALDLSLVARNITPALAAPFAPELKAAGVVQVDARLTGTAAAPVGPVHVVASGLRLRGGAAAGLPAADLDATATLGGGAAQLVATLTAGRSTHVVVRGAVPLKAGGALALHADGFADLQVLDPILTAQGRRVLGTATLQASVGGTTAAPSVAGRLTLANASVQDFAQGLFISGIGADIEADGHTLRIARLNGRAGGGTIAMSGQVGLGGTMPVDLRISANNARPIASDLVSATLDADLRVAGEARGTVSATGRVTVRRADIQLPDKLPGSVAVLDVRRPGDRPPPPPSGPGLQIPLDIALNAPQQIFVRGRGLDAELGGRLHLGGTAAAPQTSGSIGLRTGSFSLAGTTLTFTSGDISFNGATRIDPALNLIATSGTPEITATLTVGGYASAPKITLSSVPDRPQDEILAALLFGQSAASLSPFQLAQIAAALAQVSGVGGGGPDPLARLRGGLGLDRLSVGSSATTNANGGTTNTTSVEAGRYVARGVFVGAKQGVSGSQTQAEVQIDLTRGLKLNTTAGSGPGGNTVGLTYQFQY